MGRRFATTHAGRRIELEPAGGWGATTVRLFVDGEQVAQAKGDRQVTLRADGFQVRAWPARSGESFRRAELVGDGDGVPVPLDPPPGTWAARREAFARRHLALAALRHPLGGALQVALGLIGLGQLVRLLPHVAIDLPRIDLPLPSIDLPLPSIGLPSIDLPELPGWLRAILAAKEYWGPILVGSAIGAAEYRRRRRTTAAVARPRAPGREPEPG